MQTPPAKVALTNSDDVPTVIAASPGELATPMAPNPTGKSRINTGNLSGFKRKLEKEFETDPHSEYLKHRIEEATAGLTRQRNDYHREEKNKLDQTANMTFKLPQKKGGRKSNKRNKKHRKKTSKRRS
jgi:hypothetical protein